MTALNTASWTQATSQLPSSHRIHSVPLFVQEQDHCGPASLATLLSHRGIDVTPSDLNGDIYLPSKRGSLTIEMIAAARQYDLLAYPLQTRFEHILQEVAAGNPVLVLHNIGFSFKPLWHYAVVTGYDLDTREVTLHSGAAEAERQSFKRFNSRWESSDQWALVLTKPSQIPASAQEKPFLRSAMKLESSGRTSAAFQAYHAASKRWPANRIALMGMGNTGYALKKTDEAVDAYQRLVNLNPNDAQAWNNYAFALQAAGCLESLHAAHCASELAPEDDNIQNTLSEIITHRRSTTRDVYLIACSALKCPESLPH